MNNLGNSGYKISRLGLGCASYWGMPFHSEKEAHSVFHHAVESGINFFDTAHSYSMSNAEPRLGRALKELRPDVRNSLLISTKAGSRADKYGRISLDYRVEWLRQSIELSLSQLGLEALPILQLHGPTIRHLNDDVLGLLSDFKKRGLVKLLGVNSFDTNVLEAVLKIPEFDCVMLDYSIIKQDKVSLIEKFREAGKGVIGGGAMANHLYVHPIKKLRGLRDVWYLARAVKNHRQSLERAKRFEFIKSVEGLTANQVILAFALSNPSIDCCVFGTTRITHLEENLGALDAVLPPELVVKIKSVSDLTHSIP